MCDTAHSNKLQVIYIHNMICFINLHLMYYTMYQPYDKCALLGYFLWQYGVTMITGLIQAIQNNSG